MRIGIDARFFGPAGKGLGRYTQKLVENLEKITADKEKLATGKKPDQFFVFLRKENFDQYQPKNPRFHKVLADYRWYTFAEQFKMPGLLKKHNLDLVHFPHFNVPLFYRKKFVVTIHDLILIHFPTVRGTTLNPLFYWLKYLAYKLVINSAVKRSEKIIAVSKSTKEDILKNYRVGAEKIEVTYEAADVPESRQNQNEDAILRKYDIIKPYLLYVGNAYPHKNLEALVLALKNLNTTKPDLKLALVGKEDYFYKRLKKYAFESGNKNVIFAGFAPDSDLDAIYRNCEAYVFPSLYEGFGLPPLEAMARGAPVISSDHASMREILGTSAYYFDARKPENISAAVKKVLDSAEIRSELVKKGYQQVKKYSWKKMAEEAFAIYQKAVIK